MLNLNIDKNWSLFLDRDGVINWGMKGDYVKHLGQFEFMPRSLDAMIILSKIFQRIIVVTNQRGVGRGLMSDADLKKIHSHMLSEVEKRGGRIDAVYHCPHNPEVVKCGCRKPNIGMALKAKERFPEIYLSKSVVVGDELGDVEFGKNLGAVTVLLGSSEPDAPQADYKFKDLYEFANACNLIGRSSLRAAIPEAISDR